MRKNIFTIKICRSEKSVVPPVPTRGPTRLLLEMTKTTKFIKNPIQKSYFSLALEKL